MFFMRDGFIQSALRGVLEAVFPSRESEVAVRNATRDAVARLVVPHTIRVAGISVTALLPYRTLLVQNLILEAKFHKNVRAHALLGEVLADYIKVYTKSALVPIPLGQKRRRERGYNQVEEIARHIVLNLPEVRLGIDVLERIRETIPQMTLGRAERLSNMSGTFGAAHPNIPLNTSTTYILLDDVVTTGATLSAAHDALVKAGAKRIILFALAH
jgi:ComF family protein